MSANRGLFGRNRGPRQEQTPDPDAGRSNKARKREEAAEQSVALLGEVAAGYYGGDPSANPNMLALPPAPPPYIPEPLDHPHLGFTPIELPGGAMLLSEDQFEDEQSDDDYDTGSSRRGSRRSSRRRRRRARLQAEADALAERNERARGVAEVGRGYSNRFGELNAPPPPAEFDVTDDDGAFTQPEEPAIAFAWSADHGESAVAVEPESAREFAPSAFAQTPFSEPEPPAVVTQDERAEESVQLLDRREGSTRPVSVVAPKTERVERLGRGLELVFDTPHLWTLSSRVIGQVVPDANAQLLTTTDEGALEQALTFGADPHHGCTVPDREMCPAMRLDRVMRFESSDYLDACPFLAIRGGEPVSAVCVPLRSQRTVTGVLHTTAPVDAPTTVAQADELTVALALIGKRNRDISGAAADESGAEILEATIEDLVERGTPFAVALVHLDNFRLYNRAHGIDIGDAAVQRFDQIARRVVRPEDLVAGDGGDEFFMVFPQTTAKGAALVCDRIRSELAASFVDHGVPRFTVSIGVADTDDGSTFDELLAVIERAVVHAEAAGHDLVVSTKIIAARPDDSIQDLAAR
ncbi:MAG TPA: GGDEF domain-containing protein [Acidimicrobiales bacterium]|nr:GGDEF domain-containing protein [Acidimicrobiales bacterium]